MYDYRTEVKEDIIQYLEENWTLVDEGYALIAESNGDCYTLEEDDCWDTTALCERLVEDLWAYDSVTGNGSGSYWFNSRGVCMFRVYC